MTTKNLEIKDRDIILFKTDGLTPEQIRETVAGLSIKYKDKDVTIISLKEGMDFICVSERDMNTVGWFKRKTDKQKCSDTIKKNKNIKQDIIDDFHKLYYYSSANKGTWKNTYWMGMPVQKCPFDLWAYQEMIFELKPDLIIETGTGRGGTTYYLAMICDAVGKGEIISIDIEKNNERPFHQRIIYKNDSSISNEIKEYIQGRIEFMKYKSVLVLLDSNHTKEHVFKELEIYSKFVTKGSYLIVEDTNINGHPVCPEYGKGPTEAIREFLVKNKDFIINKSKEKFYLTFNPGGFLKKTL